MSSRRGGVSSGVKGLVASVKKHKKFRQLASYSVQCLKQVITPPAIGWERNLKDAFENKAANAVLDVLKLHPADEAVQEASIACLSGFSSNPKYASDLVDRNVVGVMCASLDSMSGKSGKASKQLDDTIQLLMSISQKAPEGLLKTRKSLRKNVKEETSGIGEVLHIMQAFKETRPDVVLGMARVVERLTKTATGAQAVMDAGGVEIMLETLEDELYEDRADVAQSMFRSFERMSKDKTGADRLRGEFSALDRIARVSESFQANERVSKIGGRVLTKLASGNVSELLREMQNPSTPKEKQEFLALLLSNLATEEDNVERIVKEGGVSALQTMLGSGIAKASAGAARAIGRIAESQSSFLEQDGSDATLRQMLKTLTDNAAEADTAFAVTDALNRMATGPDAVRRLAMARAYHRTLAVLKEYPEHEDHSLAAMQLLETAAVFDYDLDALTGDGIIEAVCVAMNGHDDNVAIQLAATQLLIYLASSQRNLTVMVRADVVPHLMRTIAMTPARLATSKIRAQAGAGGSSGAAAAGGEEEDEDENSASAQFLSSKQGKKAVATASKTIETTLYLLASVFLDPRNVSRLSDEDESGLLKLLPAVSRLSNEASMRETARELLEAVSTDEEVMRLLADLEGTVDRAVEGASAEDSRAAAEAVSCLSALMVLPHNAERIATEDNLKVLSAATTKVAQASKLPKQATLLNGLCQVAGSTFHALAEENPVVWGMMKSSGVVRSVVQAVKLHPKKKKLVRSSMRVIEDMARLDANEIARSGGVEAAARALRVNASSAAVVLNASNTLLQISATDAGAVAIARDGGSRQVIETINANLSTPTFERPMEAMLSVMQRVAMTTEGAEALRQQDGVSTIIDAAEALSASGSSVAQATTKVLSKLVVDTDVNTYLQDLTSLGTAAKEKGKTKADKMRPVLARIGHVSSVGSNAAKIAKGGGDRQLADVTRSVMDRLKKAETVPKGSESDAKKEKRAKEAVECQEMLPMAIKAVANVASAIGSTDAIVSAVTDVSETLQRGLAVKECFDAITAIAASDVKGAQAVQGSLGGKVAGTMVEQLKVLQQDEVATKAGFAALGSLARSGPEGRKQVAATEAGAMAAEWLEENMEDGAPQAVASALGVLGGLCSGPEGAESAKKVGAVDAAKSALSKICMEDANTEVLRSAVGVLAGLAAQGPQEAKALSDAGAFRRVMRAVAQHQEYLQDSGCATDVMNLVSLACQDADAAEDVNQAGAMGFIFASMNASGTDKGVIAAAQNALRAFGAKRDAGELTSKLAQACKALEELDEIGGQKMRDSVDEALAALEEVGNYMVVDGVVTKTNAATFLETVSNAVGLVAESELATPDQISQGLRSMSRLAALAEPGSINLKDAVEVTLDTLALYEDQAVVAEAAAECMGQMAQDSSAVDAMVELNVVTELSRMGRKHAGSRRLQDAVAACVDTVTKSTQKDIKKLAASASGSEFLTGLLAANATDASQAQSIVSQIAAVDGGEHALFSALQKQMAAGSGVGGPPAPPASGAGGPPRPPGSAGSYQQGSGESQMSIVSLEALKALANKAISQGTRYAADAGRAGALAQVLQSAISTRSKLKETSTEAEQIDAIERNRNAVVLVAASQLQDARAAGAFVASKGLENLLQLLEVDVDDAEVAPLLLKSIEQVVRHRDAKVIDSLANEEDTWMIASSVSVHPEIREVALHVARILKHVAEVKGHNEANINRHCFQQLQAIEARWRADAEVSAEARAALKVMDLKFSSKAQAKVMAAVQSAGASLAQFATAVQGGAHVDQAQVAAISQNLEQVAQSVQGQSEENMARVDQPQLASMVQVLSHQKESAEVATRTAKVLSALSSNEENCGEIARSGGVEAIIDAVKSQPDNLDLVRALVDMLERISRSLEFRQSIVDIGAVPVLVGLCQGPCVKDPIVAEKILATIANLVFESRKNVNLVVDSEGVSAVEGCMQAHQRNIKVLENAMNALSSLTWESPHNKLVIGNTCGDEIAQVLRDFPGEKDLVQMALRALGNVSAEDAVVGFLVYEHEAVRKIAEAVDANMKDEETVALAFEVLGNFAQATQCEVKDDMSVQQYIHFDAASEKALDVMRSKTYSAPIQTACMFFLTALLADETVATDLQETDIVELLVRAMKAHDWDAELLAQAAEMLTFLPPKPSVEQFLALNGMRLLVQSLETLSTEIEVVTGMCRALCVLGKYQNQAVPMAYLPEVHLSFTSLDVPRSLLAVLETNMSSAPAVQAVAAALGSMAVEDDAAKSIAEQGMHIICEAMTKHKEDGGVTFQILRLIKLLCLVRENISLLIQADGITRLTDLFMIYDGDIMIILEAVVTLSTVATSDTEFADVMKNIEGADVLLRDVMTEYEEPAKASEDDPVLDEYTSEDPAVALEALKGDKLCLDDLQDLLEEVLVESVGAKREDLAKKFDRAVQQENRKGMEAVEEQDVKWQAVQDEFGPALERGKARQKIVRDSKSALSMMDALVGMSASAATTAKAARKAQLGKRNVHVEDALGQHRHTLTAGKIMFVWMRGRKIKYQVLVTDDLQSIVWQMADSSHSKMGSIPVSSVTGIKDGLDGKNHTAASQADLSFFLESPAGPVLALETINKGHKRGMMAAFQALLEHRDQALAD